MSKEDSADTEVDPRFPSGKWAGFYLMPITGSQRHGTELILSFASGQMTGEGRDKVGQFHIRGLYDVATGKCEWIKRYVGAHDVYYQGYNEGKGIWGTWTIAQEPAALHRGGFHIWPEGIGGMDDSKLHEEVDSPAEADPVLIPI